MILDLKNINIDESVDISTDIVMENTNEDIKKLNNVKVNLNIYKESNENLIINGSISGEMILEDAISLDDILYPFSISLIDENIEYQEFDEKSLDIIQLLWENILLEVPSKVTNVTDYSKYQGTGWKLISEEEAKTENNPFKDLII